MRFALVVTVLMSAAAGPQALLAQTVGDRVHVTTIAGETMIGEVVGAGPGGLDIDFTMGWFGWYGGRRSISHNEIEQLGRSVGVRRQWRRGLVTGDLVGVVPGLLAGDVLRDTCDLTTLGRASDDCAEVGGGIGLQMAGVYGATGGVAGLGLGSLFKEDPWETIPIRGADMAPIPAIDMLVGAGDRVRVIIAGERMTGAIADPRTAPRSGTATDEPIGGPGPRWDPHSNDTPLHRSARTPVAPTQVCAVPQECHAG